MEPPSPPPRVRPPARPAVGHLVDAWLLTFSSANTRSAYRRDLELFVQWLTDCSVEPHAVTPADVAAFRDHCVDGGSSSSTTNRRVAAVASFYRHASAAWSTADPTLGVARDRVTPGDTPPLSPDDAAAVWRAAVELGDKTSVIVALTMFDGLKTHHVLQLDVADLVISRNAVVIDSVRRGGTLRLVVSPASATALRRHLEDGADGPLLIGDTPTRGRTRLTRFGVDYLVKRVGVRAGLAQPLTITTLRSTFHARGAHYDHHLGR